MSKVLLADDSKPIRRVVELTLSQGFELEVVADGEQAVELLDTGFAPELALIDVHMPRMDGLELCRELKRRHPDAEVLLLVGTFEPFDEDEARLAGAAGHLLKPFSADDLRAKVTSMLGPGESREDTRPQGHAGDEESRPVRSEVAHGEETTEEAKAESAPSMLTGHATDSTEDERIDVGAGAHDVAEEEVDQTATATLPKQEVAASVGDPLEDRPPLRLAEDDLDALARQIARYLSETLFAGGADELFARIAGKEVRARIERLERELEAEPGGNGEDEAG